ncbi:hypothetical protein ACFYOC_00375 [Nocardiopsis alba]|uniref:hypothetical protein n=1 Tax=Nocardiopsis alba TaxID=53437 RepID=UPI00131B2F46|nr:hypothetical protein [Nocardiopsis alba]
MRPVHEFLQQPRGSNGPAPTSTPCSDRHAVSCTGRRGSLYAVSHTNPLGSV